MAELDKAIAAARDLHHNPEVTYSAYWFNEYQARMADLLAALDAARGEAVAWVWQGNIDGLKAGNRFEEAFLWNRPTGQAGVPLYAAPPAAPVVTLPHGWHIVPRHLPDEVLVDAGCIDGYDGQRGDAEYRAWWGSAIDSLAERVPCPVLTYTQAPPAALAVPAEPVAWQYRFATPDGLTWSDWQQINSEAMAREMVDAFGKAGTRAEWRSLKVLEWGGYAGECTDADFADEQAQQPAAAVPADGRMADALRWIIRHADAPEKAARGPHRGMAAIKHVAESALSQQPSAAVPEGVRQVVAEMLAVAPACEHEWEYQLREWAAMLAAANKEKNDAHR